MSSHLRLRYPVKEIGSSTMNQGNLDSPQRAVRKRNKPKKYGDFVEESPTKRRSTLVSDSSDEEEINEDHIVQKPSALFSNDDVEGQDIFKFKTRHTKLDLQNKVKSSISSLPKCVDSPLRTPRKSFHRGSFASPAARASENTPKHVKDILKKRIIKEVDSDSAESDFSDGSSDDFIPDEENDSELESDLSSASSSGAEQEEKIEPKKPAKKLQFVKNKDGRKQKDSEYIVTPDNYFMMHSSKKIATSDHTLARLKNMNLNDNVSDESHISEEHRTKITELNQSHATYFDKWIYILSQNFNIILYGIGSKRSILQQFQEEKLEDFPCVVVNGFFPSLTIKSVLETIVIDLLENSSVPSNVGDVVDMIDSQLKRKGMDLILIVHNIDGTMLRSSKAQATLAALSQIKNVHTIASIDHINAPLLWDHSKLSKFNFTWWDVTSFLPYSVETSFETSLLAHGSTNLQLSSLRSVFHSLTTNAKGIFKIIVQHQLENQKQPHYQGVPFKELYSKSREQFLVSSDAALRAQLTEFLDHRLVRARRQHDAGETLLVPLHYTLLQHFLQEHDQEI